MSEIQLVLDELKSKLAKIGANHQCSGITNEGIQVLRSHPSLNTLSVYGCNVSDQALREVLDSLALDDTNTDRVMEERQRNEFVLTGAAIQIRSEHDKEFAQFVMRDSVVDFDRLRHVLANELEWRLVFPRHVPLNNLNPEGFRIRDFLKELAPYKDRVAHVVAGRIDPQLFDLLKELPNLETLVSAAEDDVLIGLSDYLEERPDNAGLHLSITNRFVNDEDIDNLFKLHKLKSLELHKAIITSIGLKKLMDSQIQLEHLRLPVNYAEFSEQLFESGIAKEVTCDLLSPLLEDLPTSTGTRR